MPGSIELGVKTLCLRFLKILKLRWMITFVSTLFATLLRNHKNYRDTIVPVGSLANVL